MESENVSTYVFKTYPGDMKDYLFSGHFSWPVYNKKSISPREIDLCLKFSADNHFVSTLTIQYHIHSLINQTVKRIETLFNVPSHEKFSILESQRIKSEVKIFDDVRDTIFVLTHLTKYMPSKSICGCYETGEEVLRIEFDKLEKHPESVRFDVSRFNSGTSYDLASKKWVNSDQVGEYYCKDGIYYKGNEPISINEWFAEIDRVHRHKYNVYFGGLF